MQLFVCEKPSQAEMFANALCDSVKSKKGYYQGDQDKIFTYAFGHLVKLIPLEKINENFGWKGDIEALPLFVKDIPLEPIEDKKEQLGVVINFIKKAKTIYIATDAGREGEHIFRKIYKLAKVEKPLKRLWVQNNTNQGILKAYEQAKDGSEYEGLAQAGQLREEADLLIGVNGTQLLTRLSGSNKLLSLGRVQTPTLAMIVNRDLAIESFQKEKHYTIVAPVLGSEIEFELVMEKDIRLKKDEVIAIKDSLKQRGEIQFSEKEVQEKPKNLFDLTSLQMYMNDKSSWSAQKTLDVLQSLYLKRLVTYPRTSSQYLASSDDLPVILEQHKDNEFVEEILNNGYEIEKSFIDGTKVTDHEAIIITTEKAKNLSSDEKKLYNVIFERFISSYYPQASYKVTVAQFNDGDYTFQAKEKALVDLGWRKLFNGQVKEPKLRMIQPEGISNYEIREKETSPPKRYTEKTLLNDMKNAGKFLKEEKDKNILKNVEGIGTPATRSSIIELLYKRGYIKSKGKQIVSTELGREIVKMMPNTFSLYSPKMTAFFESLLLGVEKGSIEKEVFYQNLEALIQTIGKEIKVNVKSVNIDEKKAVAKCPSCSKEVLENTKAFSCSGYKQGCNITLWKNSLVRFGKKNITVKEAQKLLEGKVIKVKLKGKSGSYTKEVRYNQAKNWVEFVK
ncbi:DNA topoisomerase [Halalkalibacterium halodurans]|uniref:DNA topoisomerase n=1 Tax=Halalkalibacterium halodurans TaxID=86665 RepID=UPI001FBA432A|nr:DNA topoisomerase [Halalkalibacterium halodurans]